jgi:hypothetical protein
MRHMTWLRQLLVTVVLSFQCPLAHATPEVGWWWNPDESGRGFFIESQNGIVYLASYLYESDGRATWLVSGGPNADPYTYSGRLLAYSSGQTLFGDYQPPAAPTDAGAVSFQFTDDTHGTLTWPGGTIAIERQRFGGPTDDPYPPDPGWWWNEAESGRGYSVEVQGDRIFIVSFMYDDAGNPLWYYSAGQMDSPTTYEGPWLQFANGQTLTGPYHPPTTPVPVGHLSAEFTGIDEATLEFSDDVTATVQRARPQAGRSTVIEVKREFKAKPTYKPAPRYAGMFNWKSVFVFVSEAVGQRITSTITVVVTGNLVWDESDLPDLPIKGGFRTPFSNYFLAPESSPTLTYTQSQVGGGGSCEGAFSDDLRNDGSKLNVNAYAQYVGTVKFSQPATTILELTCKFDDGSPDAPIKVPVLFQPQFDISGMAKKDSLTRKLKPSHPIPEITVTGNWTFAAITP